MSLPFRIHSCIHRTLALGAWAALTGLAGLVAACGEEAGLPLPPLVEEATGTISGRVIDAESGLPIPGARLGTSLGRPTVVTDAQGSFSIDGVAPGSHVVTASREGFRPSSTSVVVAAEATTRVNVALTPLPAPGPGQTVQTGSVAGRVLRPDRRPVPLGTAVEIFRDAASCGDVGAAGVASTDPAGSYLAGALPAGDYLACVETVIEGREFTGRARFVVQTGVVVQADVTVEPQVGESAEPDLAAGATVSLGDVFAYTFTLVSAGQGSSTLVIVADTLPLLDDPAGPPGPGDRDGNQAFRYVTDASTFDPDAIRYYIDVEDDEAGTATDVCFQAPAPVGFPAAFVTPESTALCNSNFQNFPTIAAARAAAEAASQGGSGDPGDQVVIVEYFEEDILDRTEPAGEIEAEDSFEVTVEAIHSVNEFRLDDGSIPDRDEENGEWCNIVTAVSAENDFVVKSACTRVVEALLEVRKTTSDALVPAGSQTEFRIEIGNNGSDALADVTVADSLAAAFLDPVTGDPGLVMEKGLCTGCTLAFNSDSTILTVEVPEVQPTDADGDGVFDDEEGFAVATLVVRTPLRQGAFCNRVTATDGQGRRDADVACVVTQVEIEFDIANDDGRLSAAGEFQDVETFQVGDSVAYRTRITNRSQVPATNVSVLWEIAPEFRILGFERVLLEDPASITCSVAGDSCSVTVLSLAPGASIVLDYLAEARFSGTDVNRITLEADELSLPVVNEEPTTVNP